MDIDLISRIKGLLESLFGIDATKVNETTTLRDLGIDSMHVVNLLLDLEQDLGIELTDVNFPPNPTLGQVAETIGRSLSDSAPSHG